MKCRNTLKTESCIELCTYGKNRQLPEDSRLSLFWISHSLVKCKWKCTLFGITAAFLSSTLFSHKPQARDEIAKNNLHTAHLAAVLHQQQIWMFVNKLVFNHIFMTLSWLPLGRRWPLSSHQELNPHVETRQVLRQEKRQRGKKKHFNLHLKQEK